MVEQDVSIRTMQDREANENIPSSSRHSLHSTYELIRVTAMQGPEREAIALQEDLKPSNRAMNLSYQALLNSIHQVANLLADLGIEPKDVIALLLPQLLETHLLLWGGQAAGLCAPSLPGYTTNTS
jgi:fatty-acyl-CoA synthase